MNRREFSAALASALLTCNCRTVSAAEKHPFTGCRMLAAAAPGIAGRERQSCGDMFRDADCRVMHSAVAEEAHVRTGFCFYDDSDGANALAFPDPLLPDGPDGTIMLGIGLMSHEMPPAAYSFQPVIAILIAHECGHILQYKYGMSPRGPWQMEPHADFLGGVILGKIMKQREPSALPGFGLSSTSLFQATQVMFRHGDVLFNSTQHHGEPEFRASMVRAGLEAADLDLKAAFEQGKRIVGLF